VSGTVGLHTLALSGRGMGRGHDRSWPPAGSPAPRRPLRRRGSGGAFAHVRRAAAELAPETIERIAQRVAALLRERESAAPGPPDAPTRLLDAEALARRLGVTRTWVYEHANELGAIAIGDGPKPRLRFDAELAANALEARRRRGRPSEPAMPLAAPRRPARRRRTAATSVPLLPITGTAPRGILSTMRCARRRWC
jgi:predicted DNA-binding transcriptional regulator AlpA